MSSFNAPAPGGWVVQSQTESMQVAPGGTTVVDGYTVGFVTGHGVHGSVFVPHSMYTADVVRQAIDAKAAELDAVATLTSNGS